MYEEIIKEFREKWKFAYQGGAFTNKNIPKIMADIEKFWISMLEQQKEEMEENEVANKEEEQYLNSDK